MQPTQLTDPFLVAALATLIALVVGVLVGRIGRGPLETERTRLAAELEALRQQAAVREVELKGELAHAEAQRESERLHAEERLAVERQRHEEVRAAELRRHEEALAAERQRNQERLEALEEARARLTETFNDLAGRALRGNNEEFMKLARRELERLQGESKVDLEQRKAAVETLVKPIRETLEKTDRQIREMEQARQEAYGSLTRHLHSMAEAQQALRTETGNLVKALRRPEVRGQWGELTLRRLAELAGMVEYCDFFEQEQTDTSEGRLRPDMIVRMPGGREIVVDVKTPLDAYISAVEAPNEEQRALHLQHHARKVKERVRELAGKAYWKQFKQSPDFVVLFIPGDQFLSAALDVDHALLEEAMQQKVVLATPTSLVALLRAVAYGWRQKSLEENAEKIRDLGELLYQRLATFSEHLGKVGRGLNSSVDAYNKAVGSFERQLLPGARKFTEMGVHPKKEVEELEPLEKGVRELAGTANPDQGEA